MKKQNGDDVMYQRKTKDVWHIELNYGYGWESESEYDNPKDAKADLAEYKEHARHYGASCRLRKTRERI